MKHIHFKFPPAPRSGKIALRIENLGKSYGSLKVIEDLSLEVERGRKIAFVGPNGAGKSTLMRIIAGVDRDYTGSIIPGAGVEIAYFAQDSAEKMSSSLNVEQEAETVCPNELAPKLRNLLGAFLFRGDDVGKSVSVLSGGERSRLALLKMLLHPANLLVLDEPTNHLDLTSKDVLLEALKTFEGTVLFVSHDRGFIDELADLVLELEVGTTPRLYYGGYSYYLEKKASLLEEARIGSSSIPARAASRGEATIQAGKDPAFRSEDGSKAGTALSWEEEKAQKARTRKLKKREEEILRRLENLAEGKKALEREMARPEVYSDGPRVKKILAALAEIEEETESLNEEWVETAEALSVK